MADALSVETGVAVSVRGVGHAYRTNGADVPTLHDLSLEVSARGYVALTGPSGAGKSTLLSLIGGLEPLRHGTIRVGDRDLGGLKGDALAMYRRVTVGFVFQHLGLVDVLSALDNVALSLALAHIPRAERLARARQLLEAVGVAHRAEHLPAALSGGERQRVAIARALANQPQLLLADEPTGNLDEDSADAVLDLLDEIRGRHGCTLVVVTHNPRVAARASERHHLVEGRWADHDVA